ncbi:hypothetical protein AB5I41_11200 [Sphingomonas sp. MMS24-JH45]
MLQSLIENVPPMAHVLVVGACQEDDRILPVLAINKQLRFSFVFAYSPVEFAETLDALAGQGAIDADAFLSGKRRAAKRRRSRTADPQDRMKGR